MTSVRRQRNGASYPLSGCSGGGEPALRPKMRAAEPAPDGAAQPTLATQQHPFTAKPVLCRAHAVCCTTERHCTALHCTALRCVKQSRVRCCATLAWPSASAAIGSGCCSDRVDPLQRARISSARSRLTLRSRIRRSGHVRCKTCSPRRRLSSRARKCGQCRQTLSPPPLQWHSTRK